MISLPDSQAQLDAGRSRETLRTVYQAVFTASCPVGLFLFFLPLYSQALGASATEIGELFAVFALVPVVARPLVGRGVDRFGRRPFILAGLACFVVAWLLYAASARVAVLFAARVVEGAAAALLLIAAYAVLADLVPFEWRGAAVGRLQSMINLGAFLGGGIGFPLLFIAERVGWGIVAGWRLAFGIYAILTVAMLLGAVQRIGESGRRAVDGGRWTVDGGESSVVSRQSSAGDDPLAEPKLNPQSAIGNPPQRVNPQSIRRLWPLLVICLGTATANGVTQPILTLYLREHFTDNLILLLLAFVPAAIVYGIAPAPLGRLSDRIGRRRVMATGLALAGLVAAVFPSLPNILLLGAVWTLEALFISAAVPSEGALVADLTGGDRRGQAYGLYSFAVGLGATLGPLLGGWCYDNIAPTAPFYLNAVLLPTSALLVLLLPLEAK